MKPWTCDKVDRLGITDYDYSTHISSMRDLLTRLSFKIRDQIDAFCYVLLKFDSILWESRPFILYPHNGGLNREVKASSS